MSCHGVIEAMGDVPGGMASCQDLRAPWQPPRLQGNSVKWPLIVFMAAFFLHMRPMQTIILASAVSMHVHKEAGWSCRK